MKIIVAGPKCSGKSTVGRQLANRLDIPFVETDAVIESLFVEENSESLACHDIHSRFGEAAFRRLERKAIEAVSLMDWCVISTGGSTLLDPDSRRLLRKNSVIVFLKASPETLWSRLLNSGPSTYHGDSCSKEKFLERVRLKIEAVGPFANIMIDTTRLPIQEIVDTAVERVQEELSVLSAAPNTLGQVIRMTTFGESHGPAIGAVLDGVPPGLPLEPGDIQRELDRRRPGQSKVSTTRKEEDEVQILSGLFEGKTTGSPIALLIENKDADSSKYDTIRDLFRPGHADFTFWKKFGIRDHRGGGRSSGRETASRVAGGAVAKKILSGRGVRLTAYALEIAGIRAEGVSYDEIERNCVRCPDADAASRMEEAILEARSAGDSVGGIVQLEIKGVPAGLGDPVFGKLNARLGAALLSLGAVKGIEFGDGFYSSRLRGSQFNDPMRDGRFLSNHAGGILGGISSGADIILRLAVKPTPSVSLPQETYDTTGKNRSLRIEGRHDPCIVPRIIPVVEAMAALVILDLWDIQKRLRPTWDEKNNQLKETV